LPWTPPQDNCDGNDDSGDNDDGDEDEDEDEDDDAATEEGSAGQTDTHTRHILPTPLFRIGVLS
jgi:hypothetical protein